MKFGTLTALTALCLASLGLTAFSPSAWAGFALVDGSKYEKSPYQKAFGAIFRIIGTEKDDEVAYATGVAIEDGRQLYTAYPDTDAPWPRELKRLQIANRAGEIVYDSEKHPAAKFRISPGIKRILETFCASPCPESVRHHAATLEQGLIIELPFAITSTPLQWSKNVFRADYGRAVGFPMNTYFSYSDHAQDRDVFFVNRGKLHLTVGEYGPLQEGGTQYLLQDKADNLLFLSSNYNYGLNGAPLLILGGEVAAVLAVPQTGWLAQYYGIGGASFVPYRRESYLTPLLTREIFATFEAAK